MWPKVYLIGYPGSQEIVPASKWLVGEYLPMFDVTYLNYKGGINGWGQYVAGFMRYLTDEYVIIALDDYLVSDFIDIEAFDKALRDVEELGGVDCVKLCHATEEENKEYPVTTQYCLWKRETLIEILEANFDPWRFEVHGSRNFKGVMIHRPCIPYFTNSSISGRWLGKINITGLNEKDVAGLIREGLLPEEKLFRNE